MASGCKGDQFPSVIPDIAQRRPHQTRSTACASVLIGPPERSRSQTAPYPQLPAWSRALRRTADRAVEPGSRRGRHRGPLRRAPDCCTPGAGLLRRALAVEEEGGAADGVPPRRNPCSRAPSSDRNSVACRRLSPMPRSAPITSANGSCSHLVRWADPVARRARDATGCANVIAKRVGMIGRVTDAVLHQVLSAQGATCRRDTSTSYASSPR